MVRKVKTLENLVLEEVAQNAELVATAVALRDDYDDGDSQLRLQQ